MPRPQPEQPAGGDDELFRELQDKFGTADLFKVLQVSDQAEKAEIDKAYRLLALKYHPDRAKESKEIAHEKFILAGKVHAILSNKNSLDLYRRTGSVLPEEFTNGTFDISDYVRSVMPDITFDDILEYEKKYKGSEREKQDIIDIYTQHKGNMNKFVDEMFFLTIDTLPDYLETIRQLIREGRVEHYKQFDKGVSKSKMNWLKREAKQAEKALSDAGGMNQISLQIRQNNARHQAEFDALLDQFEQQYSEKQKKPAKKKASKAKKSK